MVIKMKVLNDILGYKGLKLYQDQDYFCFSLDSVVLANYCNIRMRDSKIVEFCSGNGVVSIIMSRRTKANIIGVEIQEKLYNMANESLELNNLNNRITFINDDIKNFVKDKDNYVDMIVCNPPYFKYDENNKINESIEKRIARHEVCINIDEICACASKILKDNGKLCIVHRTDRFNDVYESMKKYRIEPKRIKFVYSNSESEAEMFLIEGQKNANRGLIIDKPLIVRNIDGSYTEEYIKLQEEIL